MKNSFQTKQGGKLSTPEERQARIAAIKAENDRLHELAGTLHSATNEEHRAQQIARAQAGVDDWATAAEARFKTNLPIYVYKSIHIAVDSFVNDEQLGTFDIRELQAAGLGGWEVVSVVPRTTGVGLKNTSFGSSMGTSWGAGIGGNVVGVHVLLAKMVTSTEQSDFEQLAKPTVAGLLAEGYAI